jgi:hypothetical protein
MSQTESQELVLRFRPTRKDPAERDKLRDALRFIARKFGWDLVVDVETHDPTESEP